MDIYFNASVRGMKYIKTNHGMVNWSLIFGYQIYSCCTVCCCTSLKNISTSFGRLVSPNLKNIQDWNLGVQDESGNDRLVWCDSCSINYYFPILKFFCCGCGQKIKVADVFPSSSSPLSQKQDSITEHARSRQESSRNRSSRKKAERRQDASRNHARIRQEASRKQRGSLQWRSRNQAGSNLEAR